MNVDQFFTIGKTHLVCQDYVMTGREGDTLWAVVADGCSGAPHSELGAGILCAAASRYVTRPLTGAELGRSVIATAEAACGTLHLPVQSLSATLLTLRVADGFAQVFCYGDGVVMARRRDGSGTEVHEVRFPNAGPYYLRYELFPEDKERYLKQFGERYDLISGDTASPEGRKMVCDRRLSRDMIAYETFCFDTRCYDLVAIFSDGAAAFADDAKRPLDPVGLAAEFMQFKNYKGQFVHRRASRTLENLAKRGYRNLDDFSVAAVEIVE